MGMMENESDTVIVRATLTLAHNLGLSVTAEGVCSEPVWAELMRYECDQAQGHYISPPVTAEVLGQWMATARWRTLSVPSLSKPVDTGWSARDHLATEVAL